MNESVGNQARHVSLSLATFVLVCFFFPWVQLSCVGVRDSASGADLARSDGFLWVIPISMAMVLITGLIKVWKTVPSIFSLSGLAGGCISAYSIYLEHVRLDDAPRLVATRWTVLFWLVMLACVGIAAASLIFYVDRSRAP